MVTRHKYLPLQPPSLFSRSLLSSRSAFQVFLMPFWTIPMLLVKLGTFSSPWDGKSGKCDVCVYCVYTHTCVCVCVWHFIKPSKFRKIKISSVLPLLYFMAGFLASSFMCILYKIGDKSLEEEEAGRSPEIPFQKLEPWKVSTIKEYRWLEFEGFKPPNLESAGGPHLRFETSSVSRARECSTIK